MSDERSTDVLLCIVPLSLITNLKGRIITSTTPEADCSLDCHHTRPIGAKIGPRTNL